MTAARETFTPPVALPLVFTLDDDEYALSVRDARVWLAALACEPPGFWWQLIPDSLDEPGRSLLLSRLVDNADAFDLDDLERLALFELSRVLGIDVWAAHRLAGQAYANWLPFDAWCVSHGHDPLGNAFPRLLSAVWGWRLDQCQEKKDFQRLRAEIFAPPPALMTSGNPREAMGEQFSAQQESDMFAAIVAGG